MACLDAATGMPEAVIPGVVAVAVDKNGEDIFSHASGFTSLGGDTPMTLDTVFWLASCTKLLTSIACMQLVESGKLSLDDSGEIDTFAPELKDLKVLTRGGDGRLTLVQQERAITLRMLMTHTAIQELWADSVAYRPKPRVKQSTEQKRYCRCSQLSQGSDISAVEVISRGPKDGTVYVMLKNRTAELMIESKAVVEAK